MRIKLNRPKMLVLGECTSVLGSSLTRMCFPLIEATLLDLSAAELSILWQRLGYLGRSLCF